MKKVKHVFKCIATGFLVLLVTLCIYTFIVTDLLKKDYVNVFGYTYFVVATGSMSGTIEVDDIILVRLTDQVEPNDIITFKGKDGDIITHRLIRKDGSKYITKGDVNNVADEAITKDQIIGKVRFIVSPSFILKSIAVFLIIFIFLALVNFDNIIKKYIVKEEKKVEKIPDEIFVNPKNRYEEPSSGLTVTISIDAMEDLNKQHEEAIRRNDNIELLEDDEFFTYSPNGNRRDLNEIENETVNLVISILKVKQNNLAKARMNKKWLTRYQYVYKLCHLVLQNNTYQLIDEINKPPFREIYDYDLEKVGLTDTIRNRVYEMPMYGFLKALTYTILYNDDEMFDGIYKIMKYKVMIDKDNYFKKLKSGDAYSVKQIKSLISFMQKVSNKFDNKHVFELDKIERMVKIKNY